PRLVRTDAELRCALLDSIHVEPTPVVLERDDEAFGRVDRFRANDSNRRFPGLLADLRRLDPVRNGVANEVREHARKDTREARRHTQLAPLDLDAHAL